MLPPRLTVEIIKLFIWEVLIWDEYQLKRN